MHLNSLYIDSFRCIRECNIRPSERINCIVGDNASGKTSVLESIYLLGRGQSFRQNQLSKAIRENADAFTIRGRAQENGQQQLTRLGCHVTGRSAQFKLDNLTATRRYDLVAALPLQHIDPNVHRLLEQGPQHRRHFLDWGVFHVEHAFFPAWRRYRRALKQRNRALRFHRPKHEVIAWDNELVGQGEIVDACRRRYLELIKKQLPENTNALIGEDALEFHYQPGWRGDDGYGAALAGSLEQDIKARITQNGPHRADIRVNIAATRARDWVSRGQQKILTAALLLAQAHILYTLKNVRPILLIDDMAAELGKQYRETLAEEILRCGAQSFVTFLDPSLIPRAFQDQTLFHVEQGRVSA
ncbi:DNA replication/repair protein RecF [Salinisphaera sp. Q1T1-3]|uniref:DNA replication/repair protein RecF n=1 Tax=Salinisphaera sp. Q1T1-3 TaxID=2321229 RepID=UPI000E7574CC|nr:DNA replication/repair protein RecF [Salinisphaera sp. Q1T1-3]RJS92564.1 DNA replication/repair protein RecF [Salinisphaera sp. Q1T1-3]